MGVENERARVEGWRRSRKEGGGGGRGTKDEGSLGQGAVTMLLQMDMTEDDDFGGGSAGGDGRSPEDGSRGFRG